MANIKSTTILFENDVLELIHKQANLDGQSTTEYMRNAVLEKLEDSLDYQDAVEIFVHQMATLFHVKT